MSRTEEIITEKELAELSSEIMKTANDLNALLNRAGWANLRIDVDKFETRTIGQKYPVPLIQVSLFKEV